MEVDQPISKPSRLRFIQGTTLTLLLLAGLVNFLDRSSLSIANNAIRSELHITGTQMGALFSAFSLAYGIASLPTGLLLDLFGVRLTLGTGLGLWSLAQLLTSWVGSMRVFLPLRILLGLGEAPFFPAGIKSIREWFPPSSRGRATGILNMSTTIGLAVAPPLLTALMLAVGWR